MAELGKDDEETDGCDGIPSAYKGTVSYTVLYTLISHLISLTAKHTVSAPRLRHYSHQARSARCYSMRKRIYYERHGGEAQTQGNN